MTLIVDASFELSSYKATLAEKATRIDVWTEALFGIIPELRLHDAFLRAFKDHDSPFPVNAYEIKAAWQKLCMEEVAAQAEAIKQKQSANPIEHCPDKARHCHAEGSHVSVAVYHSDEGEVIIADPFNLSKDLRIPCPSCRPKANGDAWARHRERNGNPEIKPIDIVESFNLLPDDRLCVPETAKEIILCARRELTKTGLAYELAERFEKTPTQIENIAFEMLDHVYDYVKGNR